MKGFFSFIGRTCLSLVFISSIINHILHWDEIHPYFIRLLQDWDSWLLLYHPPFASQLEMVIQLMHSHLSSLIIIGMICAGIGSVAIFLGMKHLGALLLLTYLIPETIIAHPFWIYQMGEVRQLHIALFLNNIGILGGVLILASSKEVG